MPPPPRRSPGQRAGLTRDGVLAAARVLLAQRGAAGLSMRALAAALGVSPNALYSHVEDKAALIDAVLDDVLGAVAVPDETADDPVAALHAVMASTFDVLLEHPDLVPAFLARQGARGANARRLGASMVVLLGRAGVTGEAADEAVRVLVVHAIGFAGFTTAADDAGPGPEERRRNFDRGLGWLLAGIVAGRLAP